MATDDSIQRAILSIPDRKQIGLTTHDAKDPETRFPPITALHPPAGASNVLLILFDDVGFGASSVFGGPCRTPTAERSAADGLTTAFTQLFSGTVEWVQIDIGAAAEDADHRIGAEERFNLAMARQ
jgi:hypothetical protein